MELKDRKIRVNAVSPGPIETPALEKAGITPEQAQQAAEQFITQVPLGRRGKPEEIAAAVVFFASDESSYITGVELAVDGAWCRSDPARSLGWLASCGSTITRSLKRRHCLCPRDAQTDRLFEQHGQRSLREPGFNRVGEHYELRNRSSSTYLSAMGTDNSTSTVQLSSLHNYSRRSVAPRINHPRMEMGSFETWTISPVSPPIPQYPYQES